MGLIRFVLKVLTLGRFGKIRDPAEASLRSKMALKKESKQQKKQEQMEKIKVMLAKK